MSLSLAMSSALSGISVTSRATQLVADNIANQQTEGYGVRSLDQSARALGGTGSGVQATGIHRNTDPALIAEQRNATSRLAGHAQLSDFWNRIESAIGLPGEPGSLSHSFDTLELALSNAATAPDSTAHLTQIAQAARDISSGFGSIQNTLQQTRASADAAIGRDVAELNESLAEVARLNRDIQRQTLTGGAPQALMDNRQAVIDKIAQIVPVTEIARGDGRVALMAKSGAMLVDSDAATFSFSTTPGMSPKDTIEDGPLSGLTLDGKPVPPQSDLFANGRLGAAFSIRDTLAPDMQGALDDLAADIIGRFMQAEADQTGSTEFGLFALDSGATWPPDTPGLAGRMALNPLVDPAAGGELARLRSGIHATDPTFILDNTYLSRLRDTMADVTLLSDPNTPGRTASGHAADLISVVGTARLDAETRNSSSSARHAALEEGLAARGVDSDAELSKLLLLEQAYGANARVLASIDAMLRRILEI